MTRNLRTSLLIASLVILAWATTSEACHRRRACGCGTYGGYDFGRPGYNPGGLGGPMSGLGVRPGLGFGGFGPGR